VYEMRQVFLPYAIIPVNDSEFLFVNRKYKPIGVLSGDHVDYETHPSRVKMKGLTPAKAAKAGLHMGDNGYFYFYSDATIPTDSKANWDRYEKILQWIAAYQVSAPR